MNSADWSEWSEWHALADLELSAVPVKPGAYIISAARPIQRSIGEDILGVLDIGESLNLRQRIRDFIRCATRHGDEGHMAGWRCAFFRFERLYPFSALRVRWLATATKAEAYEIEGRLFLEYLLAHAELPPLNYSFNWSVFRREGWDHFDKLLLARDQKGDADSS